MFRGDRFSNEPYEVAQELKCRGQSPLISLTSSPTTNCGSYRGACICWCVHLVPRSIMSCRGPVVVIVLGYVCDTGYAADMLQCPAIVTSVVDRNSQSSRLPPFGHCIQLVKCTLVRSEPSFLVSSSVHSRLLLPCNTLF